MRARPWPVLLIRLLRIGFLILWIALLTFLMSPMRAMGWGPHDAGLAIWASLMVICLLPAGCIGMWRGGSWRRALSSYALMVLVPALVLEMHFRPEEKAFLALAAASPDCPKSKSRAAPFDWCSMHYEPGRPVMVID